MTATIKEQKTDGSDKKQKKTTKKIGGPVPTNEEDRLTKFKRIVESLHGQANILVTQVDPDAVGSAVIMAKVLEVLGCKAKIHYSGDFGHPQNRSIANKFNLADEMQAIPLDRAERKDYFAKLSNFILVDSSLGTDSRVGITVDPMIVIDHHRGSDLEDTDDKFIWIEDVGSACTLVTELIRDLEADLSDEEESIFAASKKLAVLAVLGIHTDTGALVSAGPRDHEAYKYVTSFVSPEDISQLIHYTFPPSHYRNMKRAMGAVKEKESRLIASLGAIKKEERDDLSTIAEWFLRKDGITFVVVWGIVDNVVQLSARCSNLSIRLDNFLKERLQTGGAKLNPAGVSEGGASINLGSWIGSDNIDEVKAMVGKRMEEWILGDLEDA